MDGAEPLEIRGKVKKIYFYSLTIEFSMSNFIKM